jgi:hypothetical protein
LTKIVFLLGAGATVSDVATKPRKDRPPLDRRFFAEASLTHSTMVGRVRRYITNVYDRDILAEENDRLETVMGQVYTDVFNPVLENDALETFRQLLRLFNRRLALTTNNIHATNKRLVYRLITHALARGIKPADLTIITYNQDLQVEKMLYLMSTVNRWQSLADRIFSFPELYALPPSSSATSSPTNTPESELFPRGGDEDQCIRLLKLHGSLNWYSSHSSTEPSRSAMFKPDRKISITRRRFIEPGMTLQSTQRQMYTLPVVVPPVTHKSAVLHSDMGQLWRMAEQRLKDADELVIFGYSCPALDFESSNQLRRSQVKRAAPARVCVIDPAPSVAERYISLLEARCLHYYRSGSEFLDRSV